MSCGSLPSSALSMYSLGFTADLFLPNSPRSSLQPNKTNRINKRMTALPNAKSTLSIAIDTVTRPYADPTATTQETVSRVPSSNLSSINVDGELGVSSCSGRLSSFPLVTYGWIPGNRGPGSMEYSAATGRFVLGLLGLEGDALGSGALLARDRDKQLFLGLGR